MVDTPRGQAASMRALSPYETNITVNYNASLGIVRGTGADWFGPLNPMAPTAPPEVAGRAFNFIPGLNLQTRPRALEAVSFATMRALADSYDLMRLVIETRKDQITKTKWKIRAKPDVDPRTKDTTTPEQQDRINYLTTFFERPDGVKKWRPWLRSLLEDKFVIDAVTLYKRRNRGGSLIALEQIDGSTIKPVIDDWGRTPQPYWLGGEIFYPPAYQQNLAGLPAVNYSTKDIVYRPYNTRVNKVYGYSEVEQVMTTVNIAMRRQNFQLSYYCYSDDTEVLTKRGWLRFAETTKADWFATRRINSGVFEWQKAYDTFRKHYSGQMVEFKGQSIDMLVTPNHRMLVDVLPRALGRGKLGKKGEHVVSAEDLMNFGTKNVGIPQTSVWKGREIKGRRFADADRRSKPVVMTGDQYCAFMGMYLAEGSINKVGRIQIAQPQDKRGAFAAFEKLMSAVFGETVYHSGKQFEITRKAFASWLRQFGLAGQKYIPADILAATPRQLAIFWRYYSLGDGRAIADDGKVCQQVYTVSKHLADDLTEVIQKMGMSTTVWERPAGKAKFGSREINGRKGWVISAVERRVTKGWEARMVDYEGDVACVCVPNKFLYVRRNGKAAWSGNTEGNIPEALIGTPDSWTPDQVVAFQTAWDAMFTGNNAQRRHAKFVPGGVAKTFIPTKEPDLKNPMDDWLARIVCFAFSVSPQQLITMMNRATAQTGAEQAKEEGNEPLKEYVKEIVDDVLETEFMSPDLEFAWDDEIVVDEAKQVEIVKAKKDAGLISVNRARDLIGEEPSDEPGADVLMVMTGTGMVPIGANTMEGKQAAIDAGLAPDPLAPPPAPFGGGGGGDPKDPDAKPGDKKPAAKDAPPDAREAKAEKIARARNVMGVFKASGVIEPVPFPFRQSRNAG